MTDDPARLATANEALAQVQPGMTIGLGSGRAVFALIRLIGEHFGSQAELTAVVASTEAACLAKKVGIKLIELGAGVRLDVAFDGADEVDSELRMIKGGGAALLREKLVMAAADKVVIFAEARKMSNYLGSTYRLPVEIVAFAWSQTQERVAQIIDNPALRTDPEGSPFVTDNGNYLLDGSIAEGTDLEAVASRLKQCLGVVEHGLFLHEANEIILGEPDGSTITLHR